MKSDNLKGGKGLGKSKNPDPGKGKLRGYSA
jgi:hypothetical protein